MLVVVRRFWWFLLILFLVGYCHYADPFGKLTGRSRSKPLHAGPGTVAFGGGLGTVELPKDLVLADEMGPTGFLSGFDDPGEAPVATLVLKYGGILRMSLRYTRTGRVPPGEIETISTATVMRRMRGNAEDIRTGPNAYAFPPIIDGWAVTPRYDGGRHVMLWAVAGVEPDVESLSYEPQTLNTDGHAKVIVYNIRVFGRNGMLSLSFPVDPVQEPQVRQLAVRLANTLKFAEEQQYDKGRAPAADFTAVDVITGDAPTASQSGVGWTGELRRGVPLLVATVSGLFVLMTLLSYGQSLRHRLADSTDEPSGPEPAYKQYFFGKWWFDYQGTVQDSLIRLQELAGWVASNGTQFILETLMGPQTRQTPSPTLSLVFMICIAALCTPGVLAAGILYIVFGLIHFAVIGTLCLLSMIMAGAFWLLERLSMAWRSIFIACPNRGCYKKIALPIYICPQCGVEHRRLMPGPYGTLERRCRCGHHLPTLFLNGRNQLPSLCPHCRKPLTFMLARGVYLPVVGGTSAGKSCFLTASMMELYRERERLGIAMEFPDPGYERLFQRAAQALLRGEVLAKTADTDVDAFMVALTDHRGERQVVYLYDAAGELYQQSDDLRRHEYLSYLHGVLLLIDPFSLAVRPDLIAPANRPSTDDPQEVYDRWVRTYREVSEATRGRSDRPVAVILAKADAVPDLVDPRHWLLEHGGGNLVRSLESGFQTVRYFACSALGRTPDNPEGRFQPARVLEPVLWILGHHGFVVQDGAPQGGRPTVA